MKNPRTGKDDGLESMLRSALGVKKPPAKPKPAPSLPSAKMPFPTPPSAGSRVSGS